jgi:FSR family fosmidomycin resistance protein-like MFS transporter
VAGFTPAQASLSLSVLMIASLAADLISIPLLERIPGRLLVRASAAVAIVIYTAWLLAPWPLVKIVLLLAIRFSTLGWYPVLQGEAYAAVPGRSGTVLAVTSLGGLAGGALTWLVGWLAGSAGLAAALWLLLLGPVSLLLFVPGARDLGSSIRDKGPGADR